MENLLVKLEPSEIRSFFFNNFSFIDIKKSVELYYLIRFLLELCGILPEQDAIHIVRSTLKIICLNFNGTFEISRLKREKLDYAFRSNIADIFALDFESFSLDFAS